MTARKLGYWSSCLTNLRKKKYQLGGVAKVNDHETTVPQFNEFIQFRSITAEKRELVAKTNKV